LGLTLGAGVAWELRFGSLGPDYNSDAAVHGAMILRPVNAHFIYYWGQTRLGSIVPAIGKVLHALLRLGAAESAQLAVYVCVGLALFLALGLLRSLPSKLLFLAICAFPPNGLARAMLTSGQHLPGVFLFALLEIRALLWMLAMPMPLRAGAWGLAVGGLLWAGDLGVFLLLAQLPLLVIAALRTPARTLARLAAGSALGLALPATLIVARRWRMPESPIYRRFLHSGEVWHSLANLDPSLRPLAPLLGAPGVLLIAVIAAGIAAAEVLRLRRVGGPPPPLTAVGIASLLGLVTVAASCWFELNARDPRYLSSPTLLTMLSLALLLDAAPASALGGWAPRIASVVSLCLAGTFTVVGLRAMDTHKDNGDRWRARTRWVESVGCRSVIGGYWDSYPYFALSEGRVLATPHEGEWVRERSIALAAARAPLVCAIPWWGEDAPCPAMLEQFGAHLRFQDELIGHVSLAAHPDEPPLRVCRYVPET
jgi:hypothetical protein